MSVLLFTSTQEQTKSMSNPQPIAKLRRTSTSGLKWQRLFRQGCYAAAFLILFHATQRGSGEESPGSSTPFGAKTASGGALIGIFYDLKQNQTGQPVSVDYLKTFAAFVDSGWDEAVLSPFFKVTRPIYATQVFTPYMPASEGPKVFGVENIVKPSHWMVVFKGQVSPPEDGVYRFVGASDDIMAVAVDGKTVLVSDWNAGPNPTKWVEPEPAPKNARGVMRFGDWFPCRKDQIIDLDILIGEFPGGKFGAWVAYEKQGVNYPLSTNPALAGDPVVPVFQLAHQSIPPQDQRVPYTTDAPTWKSYQ